MIAVTIVDLFAGPGGWSEGLRELGAQEIGIEIDAAACATRAAAGHLTIRADVASYPTAPFAGRVTGLVASPPCQAWSRAGKSLGLQDQPLVRQAVEDLANGLDTRAQLRNACKDPRSILAAEPMRWLNDLRPAWVCMEEVPAVQHLWRQYVARLRGWGYSTWTGTLNAADYGIPQTRKRAILIAARTHAVAAPEPTHTQHPGDTLFGTLAPWVSMAEALGWTTGLTVNTRGDRRTPGGNEFPADGPAQTLVKSTRSWVLRSRRDSDSWVAEHGARHNRRDDQPAPTFTSEAHRWRWAPTAEQHSAGPDGLRITVGEAAVLQSFRGDYPWQGSRTKQFEQIGNAVPPRLAAAVMRPLIAADLEVAA